MINLKEILKYNLFFLALCFVVMGAISLISPIMAFVALLPIMITLNVVLIKRIYGRDKAFFTGIIYNLSILIPLWLFVLISVAYDYITDDPLKDFFPTEAFLWLAGLVGWIEGAYVIIYFIYHFIKKRQKSVEE